MINVPAFYVLMCLTHVPHFALYTLCGWL